MISAGERLREERLRRKLSLEQVAKGTKIRIQFLSAIEDGLYDKLPSSAYAQGFVKNYAAFLNLPTKEILAIFRREFDEEKMFKVLPEGLARQSDFALNRIKIQQTAIGIFLIFLAIGGYLLFQYRFAFINPPLDVTAPKEGEILRSQEVVVTGKTDVNATLFVNDSPVTVASDGTFKKNLTVFPDKTVIRIRAQNRLGRQTQIDRTIIVRSSSQE